MSEDNSKPVNTPIVTKVDFNSAKLDPDQNVKILLKMIQDHEHINTTLRAQLKGKIGQYDNCDEKFNVKMNLFERVNHIVVARTYEADTLKRRIMKLQAENSALKSDMKRGCLWFLDKVN